MMSVPNESRPCSLLSRIVYPFRRGKQPENKETMGFFVDTSLCIGCKACQVACKQWNLLAAEEGEISGHSYDNTLRLSARTWRHVKFLEEKTACSEGSEETGGQNCEQNGKSDMSPRTATGFSEAFRLDATPAQSWLFSSDSCKHCADPPCLAACPTGALVHSDFGTVYPQTDICNGCASCVAACPFGVIARDEQSGHAHKCTLCLDRLRDGLIPACAKTCPTGSIHFGALEDLRQAAEARLALLHSKGFDKAHVYGLHPWAAYPALHAFYLLLDTAGRYGLPDRPVHPVSFLAGDYLRAGLGLAAALLVPVLVFAMQGGIH